MKLWHHVHVVNPDWHDAAKWYGDHTPIDNVSWEHSAHQHYKAEILRSGPNLVLMQRMQHADASDSAKIDSLGIAVDSLDAALATWTEGGERCSVTMPHWRLLPTPGACGWSSWKRMRSMNRHIIM